MRNTSAAFLIPLLVIAPLGGVPLAAAQPAPPMEPPPNGPPPPRFRSAPRTAPVEVEFAPDEPDLELHSMTGAEPFEVVRYRRHFWGGYYGVGYGWAPVYSPVCGQACRTEFVPGRYRLALSKGGGSVVPVWAPTIIRGPSVLRASYTDHSGLRTAGWVVGLLGLVGGVAMIVSSVHGREECDAAGYCFDHDTTDGGLLAGGIVVIVASGIVGSVLVAQHDEAFVTVEPLRLSNYGRARESVAALGDYPRPEGATLALHF
ncbi:MAG TPA: hypothetical protein VMI54_03110 [Polyangiaceae bacterium]|nr:hypothetical protein [Polyangiaceae bacterium]